MGEFHGEVKPIYGKWHWPLRVMQPGDWFVVDQALRDAEELRHVMGVRAAQLGIPLSVTKNDPEYPGFTKVARPLLTDEKSDGKVVDYGTAGAKLSDWYGFEINQLPFGMLYQHRQARIDVKQRKPPSVKRLLVDFLEERLGFKFDEQGFDVVAMSKHATLESWNEVSLADVMS